MIPSGVNASGAKREPYTTIMSYDPVLYWPCDETTDPLVNRNPDLVRDGQTNDITFNSTKIPPRSPKGSVSFNGTSSFIACADGVLDGAAPQYSVGVWIRQNQTTGTMHVFQQMDATSSGAGFRIYIVNGTSLRAEGKNAAGGTDFSITASYAPLNDNIPIFIGLSVGASVATLYVNGFFLADEARSGGNYSIASDIWLGSHYDFSNMYTGTISDAFIVESVLTQQDFYKIWRNGNRFAASPAYDNFSEARVITGASGTVNMTITAAAGLEPSEPDTGVTGIESPTSVWLKYVPTTSDSWRFDSLGMNHEFHLFSGTSLGSLTPIGGYSAFPDNSIDFSLTSGTTYYIRLAGYQDEIGTITFNWDLTPDPPANDDWANAQTINVATSGTTSGTNEAATTEMDEPTPTSGSAETTWFKFTADATGNITLDTNGSGTDTNIDVYTGSSLAALSLIASDDESGSGPGESLVTFAVTNGTTYYVQMSDWEGGTTYTLNWSDIT